MVIVAISALAVAAWADGTPAPSDMTTTSRPAPSPSAGRASWPGPAVVTGRARAAGILPPMPDVRPLTAVVLAAGLGTRMRSRMAKVLHPLCGRTMIGWALHAVAPLQPDRVAVVVGHQGEEVQKALVQEGPPHLPVTTVEQEKQLGTGHALMTALAALPALPDEDLLVMAGDHPLFDAESLAAILFLHRNTSAPWTMAIASVPDPTGYGRVVYDDKGYVARVVEERDCGPDEAAINEVSVVLYCIRRAEVEPLPADLEAGPNGEIYLNAAIAKPEGVTAVHLDPDVLHQVNDRVQLAHAEGLLRRRINEGLMRSGVTMVDPARAYVDVDVRVGADTTLHPNTYLAGFTSIGDGCGIGPDVRMVDTEVGDACVIRLSHIVDCEVGRGVTIGPYASLRPGCVVSDGAHLGTHVEFKNARIGVGTKVPHLSYVGDAELGDDVNFGAGTITCNYDGERKHRTVVEDGVRTGSGTMLVAPIRVGRDSYTGAGSVVTKDVPPGSMAKGVPASVDEGWVERKRGGTP